MQRIMAAVVLALAAMPVVAETWRVTALDGGPVLAEPEVHFAADGRVSVATGCNRLAFAARIEDGTVRVEGPMISTRMACEAELATQERAFVTLFATDAALVYDPFADRLTLAGGGLTATLMRAAETVPQEPAQPQWQPHAGREAPAGAPPYLAVFGRAEDLTLRAGPSAESEALGGVPSGTVLRNSGCEGGWCAVDLPDGSLAGWAEAEWLEPADSAVRAGQGVYDATALLACAMGHGAPVTACDAGIARDEDGRVAVVVQRPDGARRVLFFEAGAFVSTDASEAGGGFDTDAAREGDTIRVRVDDEYYALPDAVLTGG